MASLSELVNYAQVQQKGKDEERALVPNALLSGLMGIERGQKEIPIERNQQLDQMKKLIEIQELQQKKKEREDAYNIGRANLFQGMKPKDLNTNKQATVEISSEGGYKTIYKDKSDELKDTNVYEKDVNGKLKFVGTIQTKAGGDKIIGQSIEREKETSPAGDLGLYEKKQQIKADIQTESAVKKDRELRQSKIGELTNLIDFAESKISEIPTYEGLLGRANAVNMTIQAYLQTSPEAAGYKALLDGIRPKISRALGDVGNLTEQEQEKAMRLFPKFTDNTETRKQKLKNLRDFVAVTVKQKEQIQQPTQETKTKEINTNDRVNVINPSGKPVSILKTDLDNALKNGYKVK